MDITGFNIGGELKKVDYESLANKPFYSETKTEIDRTIIPLQEVEFESQSNAPEGYLVGAIYLEKDIDVVAGGTYDLTIDGEVYTIPTFNVEDTINFGDVTLIGIDITEYEGAIASEEDFCGSIERGDGDGCLGIILKTTETTHTIGLSYIGDYAPIIAEGSYTFGTNEYGVVSLFTDIPTLSETDVFNLNFNNISYENLTLKLYDTDEGVFCTGNLAIIGEGDDTEEDYLLSYNRTEQGILIYTSLETGDYTVSLEKSLEKTTETVHKIDSKYIDVDMSAVEAEVNELKTEVTDLSNSVGKSYSEQLYEYYGIDKSVYPYITIVTVYPTGASAGYIYFSDYIYSTGLGISIGDNWVAYNPSFPEASDLESVVAGCLNGKYISGVELSFKSNSNIYVNADIQEVTTCASFTVFDTTTIQDDIRNLQKDVSDLQEEVSDKQLVEGIIYDSDDPNSKGLSANRNAIPTAKYAWIEGYDREGCMPFHIYSGMDGITEQYLSITKTTSNKTTTTTIALVYECEDSSFAEDAVSTFGYVKYFAVIFEDEPDNTYWVKKSSVSSSDTKVTVTVAFVDNQDTFPTDTTGTRTIIDTKAYAAVGVASHSEGYGLATGNYAHAENESMAEGYGSHAEGITTAGSLYQHTQGQYNIIDTEGKYAHIVGNGSSDTARSNAHTLDWDGNAWYAGSVEATGIILPSTTEGSTKRFLITVDDTGTLTATEITEE